MPLPWRHHLQRLLKQAATRAISLRPLTVAASSSASAVTVTVSHVTETDVPLIGALLPDITVTATATMALEPP